VFAHQRDHVVVATVGIMAAIGNSAGFWFPAALAQVVKGSVPEDMLEVDKLVSWVQGQGRTDKHLVFRAPACP